MPRLGSREVLVRVKICGLCASDLKFFNGLKSYQETPYGKESPGFTGHEWAGEVVGVGPDTALVKEGDAVTPYIINSCGACKYCREGRVNLCPRKRYVHGGFAEFIKVMEENLIKLPSSISSEDACLTEPLACCLHGLRRVGLKSDDTVVIIGDGPMSLLHLMLVKRFGGKCLVVGHHGHRLALAEELGADFVLNSLETDFYAEVMRATEGYGADAVILTVNNADALTNAFRLVSKGGRVNIFAGAHPDYEFGLNTNRIHYNELVITGSADALRDDYLSALDLIRRGELKPSRIISHAFPLDRIKEAFEAAQKRLAVKVVVRP